MTTTDKSTMTVRYFLESVYLRFRLINGSPRAIDQLKWCINQFDDYLGRPATLADLNLKTLCDWMAWQVADELAVDTINGRIKLLATLWRFAIKKKYVVSEDDPADIELLKRRRRLPVAWTAEEMERLLKACRETHGRLLGIPTGRYWESLISIAYDTGLRRAPLIAIRLDEIDLATHILRVPAERMKNQVEQIFWLSDRTIAAIAATLPPARELLFPWPWKSAQSLDKRLRHILQSAGLPSGRRNLWHMIRRTTASHIAAKAGEAAAIRQLGHSDASCIRRYVDPRFTSNHESAKLLAGVAWDGRKVVVEEKSDQPESAPPLIVRLSRSDWQQQGIGLLSPLCDRDGFTGAQLAAVLDHLGIAIKEFAAMLKVDRRRLGAALLGKRSIGVGLRKRIRSVLGMNFIFPGFQESPFVPPVEEERTESPQLVADPVIAGVLRKDELNWRDIRAVIAFTKHIGVRVKDMIWRVGVNEGLFYRMAEGRLRVTPRTRDKLRAAFGVECESREGKVST